MFDRLSNGWEIAKQSWHVLRQDKELMIFPVLSGVATVALLATFALPVALIPGLRDTVFGLFSQDEGGSNNPTLRVVAGLATFAFYFLSYFVVVYFNTALASCAVYRFRGGDPTVGLGLRLANERLPQILGWSLLAATVGLILNMIEERSEWLGRIVAGLLGTVWTIATFLVVPTLAVEGLGPIDALKRSGKLISQVWGEGLAGNFGIGLVGILLGLPAVAAIVLAAAISPHWAVVAVVVVVAVAYLLGLGVAISAVKQVFIAGLYIYATEQRVPPGFDQGLMRGAFVRK